MSQRRFMVWASLALWSTVAAGCLTGADGDAGPNGSGSPTPPPGEAEATATLAFRTVAGKYNVRVAGLATGLEPLPSGQVYATWLANDAADAWLPVGADRLTDTGFLQVSYSDPDGADLLASWSGAVVSVEDEGALGAAPSGPPVLAGSLHEAVRTASRTLLSQHPGGKPPVHGLVDQAQMAEDLIHHAQEELAAGNFDEALDYTEKVYNLVAGEYGAIDLDSDANPDMGGGDPRGILPNDDGMGASHDGWLKQTTDLVQDAIADLPEDDPARLAGEALLGDCAFRTRREASSSRAAALALLGAPSPELQDFALEHMHVDIEEVSIFSKGCVRDGVIEMASIYLAP